MTENKRRKNGGQESGQHVQKELRHRHHLLSEACPATVVTEKRPAVIRRFALDAPRRPGVKEKSGKRANAPRSKPGQSSGT